MSTNTKEKTTIILCDISPETNKTDIESFLSEYKEKISSIQLNEKKPYKAMVSFKDYNSANECRINMNQKKIKNRSIRIVWDEKDFLQKNKDNKNNLYIKGIPKTKSSREIYEYFLKFGDIFSAKINEDEKGNNNGTAFVTYYNPEDAKKAIDETNGKKVWDSDLEVQYKNNDKYYNNNDNNLKVNISNLPDNYTEEDITKLCEEFGKIHICNVNKTQKGKFAIVKFSNETEAKNAMEKLNNKKIDNKKLYVKEVKDNHYYNYNYNYNNKPNYQQNYYFNNTPMMRFEEPLENNNLYVKNIPYTATEEDLKKTFGQYGKITSIKLELDVIEKKDDKETKKLVANKGFGYISFEKIEEAKNALESLNGKYLQGFESWTKALIIDYFISKDKRQNMMQNNYYGMQNNTMIFPSGIPTQYSYPPGPVMMPMPIPNQYNPPYMWNPGIYKNNGYNNYKQRYNNKGYPHRGRGGHRGGYFKNNYQKKNNNDKKNENTNNNTQTNNNNKEEEKKVFDYEKYNELTTQEEKKDFLGERIFNSIQEILNKTGDNVSVDTIGKITGMIIEIPDENEIIEILEKPSVLDSRVKEALSLLNTNK